MRGTTLLRLGIAVVAVVLIGAGSVAAVLRGRADESPESPAASVGTGATYWSCADRSPTLKISVCSQLPVVDADKIAQQLDTARISRLARQNGITLQSVPMTWGDLWVEQRVPQHVRDLLRTSLDADISAVGGRLGRSFEVRPKIVTFASAASFESGLRTLFGYAQATARSLAANNGGVLISRVVLINWAVLGQERPLTILRHELTHALVREITRTGEFPAWFDEGLATLEQDTVPGAEVGSLEEWYAGRALLESGGVTLGQLASAADWSRQSAALGGRNYFTAASAVRALIDDIGRPSLLRLLERVGGGERFSEAFGAVAGRSLETFERGLPRKMAERLPPRIVPRSATDGIVQWTALGFVPGSDAVVTIEGLGYRVSYAVTVDELGMFTGTLGPPAPAGTYTLRAEGRGASATATLRTD